MQTLTAPDPDCYGFNFDNSYLQLPAVFYKRQAPTQVTNPDIVIFNDSLGKMLGLNIEALKQQGSQFLAGNTICAGSDPIAQAYAGHQFGGFNMLGDGRAILLGEHITRGKQRFDIQLKGAGRTPYSRSGDGRASLGPMLREYIISEAMYALGIPTTRSLAVVTTGEHVYRDDAYPGAVLTRVAASHIRVGTFQFAATQNQQQLQALADYSINRHFPDIADTDNKYLELLKRVIELQASLIAKWMHVGFIHGVMNTDNMSICGETIDYGPCAFMNTYHPESVFSSIDTNGRYAFGNQPNIAHWNLVRLAESLLPLIDESQEKSIALVTESLNEYPGKFFAFWIAGMRKKLGIFNEEAEDIKLAEDLLMYMQKNHADYTNTFRSLGEDNLDGTELHQDAGYREWLARWKARLARQNETFDESIKFMQTSNPKVIPRNHLVEQALNAAVVSGDMSLLNGFLSVVANPYAEVNHSSKYTEAPEPLFDQQYKTFCGT
ncbi:MAG TPA: YdiU family protein [Methylophilaceae bacterium]|nr:YdiU family protein [Methylophilaceae bacterium]